MTYVYEKAIVYGTTTSNSELFYKFLNENTQKRLITYLLCINHYTFPRKNIIKLFLDLLKEPIYVNSPDDFEDVYKYNQYWISDPYIQKHNPFLLSAHTNNITGALCLSIILDKLSIKNKAQNLLGDTKIANILNNNNLTGKLQTLDSCQITINQHKQHYRRGDIIFGIHIDESELNKVHSIYLNVNDNQYEIDFSKYCVINSFTWKRPNGTEYMPDEIFDCNYEEFSAACKLQKIYNFKHIGIIWENPLKHKAWLVNTKPDVPNITLNVISIFVDPELMEGLKKYS
jgi:hypothetical protein